ncbi:type IV pili signal transduction protein [Massilia sp. JS1662]|nr:chemotaxis protein CheW [Massilia sp. JS1662]KGF80557.1 type IV pili signal transduction protein [Massilia sp. JS1662]
MDTGDAGQKGAARRARLRQYQEQLLERMQAARTSSGARAHQLGVEIGGVRYLLDLVEAGEIVPLPPLAAVPLTQPWYLGLANVRGSLLGVVDLARYLDPQAQPTPGTRLVTFAPGLGFPCALLVAKVVGLRHAADMTPLDARLRDADGQEWTPLSLAALAREDRFLQVAR